MKLQRNFKEIMQSENGVRCQHCLNYSVMFSLVVVICSGIATTLSAENLFRKFNGHCIFSSNLSFSLRENTTEEQQPRINLDIYRSRVPEETTVAPIDESTTTPKPKYPHIYRALWQNRRMYDSKEIEQPLMVANVEVTEADFLFLTRMEVNIPNSHWGYYTQCEYVLFYPLFCGIVAVVWGTMLFLFRAGGKEDYDWGIPKPWRIVLPSIIIFGTMTLLSFLYTVITESGLKGFCDEFKRNLTTTKISCSDLVEALQPKVVDSLIINSTSSYKLLIVFSAITLMSWLIALLIMLARCLFVIDFQLVRVTFSTLSSKQLSPALSTVTTSSSKTYEESTVRMVDKESAQNIPPKVDEFSSKEDFDDFESAHSETEMTTFNTSGHPSLEPLLQRKQSPLEDQTVSV